MITEYFDKKRYDYSLKSIEILLRLINLSEKQKFEAMLELHMSVQS